MNADAVAARGRFRYSVSSYDQRSAMLFLAPMMLVLLAVAVFPVLYSFWVSASPHGESRGFVAAGGPGFRGIKDDISS